jgi:predicted nuclease of restriction endonuclease-like RecB superfamily
MLKRTDVDPFVVLARGRLVVKPLLDSDGRVTRFADRLCRLVRKLEGMPRATVEEALRRQERRVRDTSRLGGLAGTLLTACTFEPPADLNALPARRAAVFLARGGMWPPVPGDALLPYAIDGDPQALYDGFWADRQAAWPLRKAPAWTGAQLLAQYHLELGRAVLRDAERVEIRVRGGWRALFASIKLARLMYQVERVGRGYRLTLTGPAAAFVARRSRYGARFARIVPALSRASAWQLRATVVHRDRPVTFVLQGRARTAGARVGLEPSRARYDSVWERRFARDFRAARDGLTAGWTLTRERTPLVADGRVALPDFTLRHTDGREAYVELVGFWTPEYLREKAAMVARVGDVPLVLVVAKALAVGAGAEALTAAAGDRVLWCTKQPRLADVMRVVERVATPTTP